MSGASTSPKLVNEATLLGLPLELRRQIYREIFISCSHCDRCHWDSHHPRLKDPYFSHIPHRYCDWCSAPTPPQSCNYSLLLACRQVYEEALPIMYEETVFSETDCSGTDCYSGPRAEVPPQRLSKLKHLRFETGYFDREHQVAKSIRLLAQYCPLLKDIELQVEYMNGESGDFWYHSSPEGELVGLLPGLNLRNGFSLTINDEYFIPADVAHEFRLAIAPNEEWHCNGWDYTFDSNGHRCKLKWVRMWSLGRSGIADLRFLDEPSEEDIRQIECCSGLNERHIIDRLAESARIRRANRLAKTQCLCCLLMLWGICYGVLLFLYVRLSRHGPR